MLSEKLLKILATNVRPKTQKDFEDELDNARSKGYNVPEMDYSKIIVTQDQAVVALDNLGIDSGRIFYKVMKETRSFPLGEGEELNTLDQIVNSASNPFWENEYPGIADKYLEISSIEGEGSYFYEKSTDAVYDIDWDGMNDFVLGKTKPTWASFVDFLNWYYCV